MEGVHSFFLLVRTPHARVSHWKRVLTCHRWKWITCFVTRRFSSMDVVFLKKNKINVAVTLLFIVNKSIITQRGFWSVNNGTPYLNRSYRKLTNYTQFGAQPFIRSFVSISHHPHSIVTLDYGKNELCFLFSKLLSSISLLLCAPKSNEWFDCYSARVEAIGFSRILETLHGLFWRCSCVRV